MNIFSICIILLSGCVTNTGTVYKLDDQQLMVNEDSNFECDSADLFLQILLDSKIKYERALYYNDRLNIEGDKLVYLEMLESLKKKKKLYKKCFEILLEKENRSEKKRWIQFSYYPKYLSRIPKCGHVRYGDMLLLMLYNLEHLKENDTDLKCEESLLNK